jgi:hypothetical protein
LTIRILAGHLNLPLAEEDDGPIKVTLPGSSNPITLPNIALDKLDPSSSPRDLSNHPNYQEVNIESLIKLLLRVKQLYIKIQDMIKLLS